ncbi:Cytochrome 94A2 [Capsicum baccatum]|uniref:Cytochrome 94A2 n=1 Tax=Capsicum baccatum TaxID=33114 RepID=A0A2G2VPZ9_CAPBA|nr:Cytochrome 94A2 [Capsicum baccatum]
MVVCIKDPSNVKHILKTRFNNYHKERTVIEAFSDLFGKALFLSDGAEWKSQRQILQHCFDPKEFHAYTSIVEEELLSRLVPFLSNAEKTASTIDLQDILRRFTFDSNVEKEIVREIREKDGRLSDMVYMHASIYESLRLFPPFPDDSKEAVDDNVWPDGTKV